MEEWIHVKKLSPHDQYDWVKIVAIIRKNDTGEIRESEHDAIMDGEQPHIFIWDEGNYSCDCNRQIFFSSGDEEDETVMEAKELLDEKRTCCGDGAYSVNLKNPVTGTIFYKEF
jgi:hypothetical protein